MTVVPQVQVPTSPVGWVVAAVLAGLAALAAVGLLRSIRAVWGIVRTDVVDVATAPTGERVELEGTVEPITEETVPVAGRPAVLYETDIKVKSPGRHEVGDRRWIVEATETVEHPFLVDDGTGTALVDPEAVDLELGGTRRESELVRGQRPPDRVCDRLDIPQLKLPWSEGASPGAVYENAGLGKTTLMRFPERWLEPEETVHVRGVGRPATTEDRTDLAADGGPASPTLVFDGQAGDCTVTRGGERAAIRREAVDVVLSTALLAASAGLLYHLFGP